MKMQRPGEILVKFIRLVIFFVAVLALPLLALNLLALPLIREFLMDPVLRDLCGLVSQCAARHKPAFLDFLFAGGLWPTGISIEVIKKILLITVLISVPLAAFCFVNWWHASRR